MISFVVLKVDDVRFLIEDLKIVVNNFQGRECGEN